MHYSGEDRGFILRFVNSGTQQRAIERLMEFKKAGGGSKFKWVADASQYGNRGSIAAKNFFRAGAEPRMIRAVQELSGLIDEELEKMLNYTN